jgi:hypothetical protein
MDDQLDLDYRSCSQCGESVRYVAKKCPHCLSWQGRKLSRENPVMAGIFAFIPTLLIFPMMIWFFNSTTRSSHNFSEFAGQIQVLDTKLAWSQEKDRKMVSTIGRIKNDSPYAWTSIGLEIQYFNASGELIDTVSESSYSLTVQSHSESAFRVRTEADKPREQYASHKVFVRDASEPRHF